MTDPIKPEASRIHVAPDVEGYFSASLQDAIANQRAETTPIATQYVANLLSDAARGTQACELDRPLTFLLREALDLPRRQRFDALRNIGDAVLYVLGFFGRSVSRRGADERYVLTVGASAYNHAASMMSLGGGSSELNVLAELSEKFDVFVHALRDMATTLFAPNAANADAVSRLCQTWTTPGGAADDELVAMLAKMGMCPVRPSGGIN